MVVLKNTFPNILLVKIGVKTHFNDYKKIEILYFKHK